MYINIIPDLIKNSCSPNFYIFIVFLAQDDFGPPSSVSSLLLQRTK